MNLTRLQGGVSAGVVSGIVSLSMAAALAQLILGGSLLQQYVPVYFILLVVATCLGCLVALAGSRLPVVIAGLDEPSTAIITSAAAQFVTAGLAAGLLPGQLFASLLVLIASVSLCTGVVFLLIGTRGMGQLARFIPFPVVAGFLSGTGFLLVFFGIEMALGRPFSLHHTETWRLQGEEWFLLLCAGGFGVLLWRGIRVSMHAALIPVTILLALVMFYLGMQLTGSTVADAVNARLLPVAGGQGDGALVLLQSLSWTDVRWEWVGKYLPAGLTASFVAMLSMLSNVTAIEYAAGCEVDHDHELMVAGAGNILGAMSFGVPMVYQMSDSVLACRVGAGKAVLACMLSVIGVFTILVGNFLQIHFPIFILAGLLIFFGLDLVTTWLVEASNELVRHELAIVCLIALCILVFDFLTGIVFGLLLAVILFVYQVSRISPIQGLLIRKKSEDFRPIGLKGRPFTADEPPIFLLIVLQGYIFFGSAHTLYICLKQRIAGQLPRDSLICLDFSQIAHLDSSAVRSLKRLLEWGGLQGYRFSLICPHMHVQEQLVAAKMAENIVSDYSVALKLV